MPIDEAMKQAVADLRRPGAELFVYRIKDVVVDSRIHWTGQSMDIDNTDDFLDIDTAKALLRRKIVESKSKGFRFHDRLIWQVSRTVERFGLPADSLPVAGAGRPANGLESRPGGVVEGAE